MGKSKKIKKIIKLFVIGGMVAILLSVFVGLGSFALITANASLDESKLKIDTSALTLLDTLDKEINTFNATTDTSQLQSHTINAFIAKEDKRFYKHSGIDPIRMAGAFKNNIKSNSFSQGGSTITQQLIKNTHLSQEKTLVRKLNEIKLSLELEKLYSKEEILDTYLNTIYFGNNIYGIRSASSFYFDKKVEDLSIAESAILSGLISAPSVYNPVADLSVSKQKAKIVLDLMEEQKYISAAEKQDAIEELKTISVSPTTTVGALYCSFATHEALQILGYENFPTNANIIIKTYMNSDLQKTMEDTLQKEEYKAIFDGNTMSGIGSIVLDNATGGIIAFAGNSPHNLMELRRQPASTIKPLVVYGPALEKGLISPATFVLDEPINFEGYAPTNATKKYHGWTTVRDNIVRSTNVPAVKVLNEVGTNYAIDFASNLGIKFEEADNNLAIALGGMTNGTTIKDLATAYMCLARGGNYTNSTLIKEIIIDGIVCYKHFPASSQILKESTAYLLTDMLQSVAQYGTGRFINTLPFEIASKTGTNAISDINHDGWNASYTSEHTAVCWIGNLGEVATENLPYYNGSLHPTHYVKEIFTSLYESTHPADFVMPDSVKAVNLDKDLYLDHQLFLADNSSTDFVTEVFEINSIPQPKPRNTQEISLLENANNGNNDHLNFIEFIKRHGFW